MPSFFEVTFGPAELSIIDNALHAWRSSHSLAKDDPDVSLAAEICINLFREGNKTLPELQEAMTRHKALNDMVSRH